MQIKKIMHSAFLALAGLCMLVSCAQPTGGSTGTENETGGGLKVMKIK